MRTFVALNLPAEERARIDVCLQPLRERPLPVRWVAADALHLTLMFIGDTEPGGVDRIGAALSGVMADHAPLDLRFAGLGAFPSLRRAAVIWIGVDAVPEVMAVQRDIEQAISRLGYPREQRPFRPHITVGRVRKGARPPDMLHLHHLVSCGGASTVETVDVMRSHTDPDRARYELLRRVRLGAEVAS
jgi:RNA 2',3'-cyclic 3'-phosphodiesterase